MYNRLNLLDSMNGTAVKFGIYWHQELEDSYGYQ